MRTAENERTKKKLTLSHYAGKSQIFVLFRPLPKGPHIHFWFCAAILPLRTPSVGCSDDCAPLVFYFLCKFVLPNQETHERDNHWCGTRNNNHFDICYFFGTIVGQSQYTINHNPIVIQEYFRIGYCRSAANLEYLAKHCRFLLRTPSQTKKKRKNTKIEKLMRVSQLNRTNWWKIYSRNFLRT